VYCRKLQQEADELAPACLLDMTLECAVAKSYVLLKNPKVHSQSDYRRLMQSSFRGEIT
jgi:hypothetical protein